MAVAMLISAVGIFALSRVESLWLLHPLCSSSPVLASASPWALANVATQTAVPPEMAGAASFGVTATSLVMLGAVGVAIAASDAAAIEVVLKTGALLALVSALSLLVFGHGSAPPIRLPVEAP
jgi:hypothetical protein